MNHYARFVAVKQAQNLGLMVQEEVDAQTGEATVVLLDYSE
jgi:hypothetical protein